VKRQLLKYFCPGMVLLFLMFILPLSFNTCRAGDIEHVNRSGLNKIIADNKGKVVLVNLWATWCPYCRKELPGFNELYKKYKDKIEIIGVSFDKNGEKELPPFLKKWEIKYPVYLGGDDIPSSYDLLGFPTTIIYDTEGSETKKHVGYVSKEVFEENIKKLVE